MNGMKGKLGALMAMAMMFDNMMPSYNTGSNGDRYCPPTQRELDAAKSLLVHNKLQLHTLTIHGVEIQAPNKKAAIKIYNRKHSKKQQNNDTQ
jgi:hypothetical protein